MLTDRQVLTLEHLHKQGIKEPMQIIEWCAFKLTQPHRSKERGRINRRKRGKTYYQEILNYFAQGLNQEHRD